MRKPENYIEILRHQTVCPVPIGIILSKEIAQLGFIRMNFFLDRFIQAYYRSRTTDVNKLTFDVFKDCDFFNVQCSKKLKQKMIEEGIALNFVKNLLKINDKCWFAEFDADLVFNHKSK